LGVVGPRMCPFHQGRVGGGEGGFILEVENVRNNWGGMMVIGGIGGGREGGGGEGERRRRSDVHALILSTVARHRWRPRVGA
jgi:hypothetical protein